MIYGIGTDVVAVPRLQISLDRYGERFAARILTTSEMSDFRQTQSQAHFLAKRFAAKEALVKALGTGFRDGLSLRDVAVANDALGKPVLVFSDKLADRLRSQGVTQQHLSLTDEREYALAFVILECL
ncbi:MAG: holo-ACP synthase [Gammaproteobacteria bacterium]|nr:holo-ACP synthase [Gammaproteobacteria bacterium]MCF6361866.1 holo-ACP synthase [Gammaproteobacteria bacterium]